MSAALVSTIVTTLVLAYAAWTALAAARRAQSRRQLLAGLLPAIIAGSVFIETVFTIPGMGFLAFQSVLVRDYPMVMAIFKPALGLSAQDHGDIFREVAEAGIDIICDGEQGKASFLTYVSERLSGFEARDEEGEDLWKESRETLAFPEFYEAHKRYREGIVASPVQLVCTGPLTYTGQEALQRDIATIKAAAAEVAAEEVFMTAISPSDIEGQQANEYYASEEEYLEAIALARLILPPEIHLQAPPNLSDDFGPILDAGIDDWGGVSPVTADHVNPERPWPELDRLREVTEAWGFTLAPRLTVYPEYVRDDARWIHADLRFPVMDRSDAEGLGRDDPGAVFPEEIEKVTAADGAEVRQVGHRSTAWYSGSPTSPMILVPAKASARGQVREVLDGVMDGQQADHDELLALFGARGPEVAAVAEVADELWRQAEDVIRRQVRVHKRRSVIAFQATTNRTNLSNQMSQGPLIQHPERSIQEKSTLAQSLNQETDTFIH